LIKSEENIPKNIVKPASSYFNDLDTILKQRGSAPDLPITSLYDFNRKLWGFKKGQLYIIGSYTSHGKSSFCLQLSQDWVNQNFSVVYLSLEMPVTRCLERMLCQKYKITNTDLLTGKRDRYSNDIKSFEEDLKKWRLVITDCIGFTWQEVDSLISRLKTKPDIIILDYAQITKRLGRMQKDAYDEYIKHFREMAIRHNFCAIIVSQIGRASKDSDSKEPQLHHLQGTSLFEIHADCVILLKWKYRDTNNLSDFNKYTIFISKNRDGATGYCELFFIPENYLFVDIAKEPINNPKNPVNWQDEEE